MERNAVGCAKPAIFCWALLCSILGASAMTIFFIELFPPRQSGLALAISGGSGFIFSVAGCMLWSNLCCNPCEGVTILPSSVQRLLGNE